MRLHVLSDLHREQGMLVPPTVEADLVVLAGDIAAGTSGLQWARAWAAGRPVLYIAGNHEFYGHSMPGLIDELRRAAAGSSVHVLENDELIIDGVRFLGCTLWSDFDFGGPERRAQAMQLCERVVNDYEHITFGPHSRALTPRDTRMLHLSSRRWLASRLAHRYDGPTVVVTHHAPLIRTRPSAPALRALAGAFASDVTDLMGADRVGLWIFGHTHRVADLEVRGTRVISNPYGYPHQLADGFDPSCVIDVGREVRQS
ncbi:MAG: metallophosphoesterase [Solirubrobacteraceae bacterium]